MRRAATRVHLEAPSWVFSYADVMSLLLVLFVFLCGTGRFPLGPLEERRATLERVALAEEPPDSAPSAAAMEPEARESGSQLLASVYFERGSSRLTDEAMARLESAAAGLGRSPWPLVALGRVSPLVDEREVQPQGDAHDLAFERALRVAAFLESLPSAARERWPEVIAASAGYHGEPIGLGGADLHDARDRVDIYPIDPPASGRRLP